MKRESISSLLEVYYKDKYHFEFVDKLAEYIDKDNLELYSKVVSLSLEAPFDEELEESYQLSLELLCKSLGFGFDKNCIIYYKEEDKNV